jgi:3-oxoacyl-[acyl-carrier-protein] synthase III
VIISSISLRTPSVCVTNEGVLDRIRETNAGVPCATVERYCAIVGLLLERTGVQTRYIRDKANGERGFDLMIDAAKDAISKSGIAFSEIDLIIFCGVGRGFLEPANAIFVAKALGIECEAFDVGDACMSWVRSLQLAHSMLKTGTHSNVLIVNAEFTVHEHGIPDALKVCTDEALKYTFPALTIGEAATATVVSASERPWTFRFRSRPEFASLCTLPLPGYQDFCDSEPSIGLNGPLRLVSFGNDLSRAALREMMQFVNQTYPKPNAIDLWFPHTTSEPSVMSIARPLGAGEKVYTKAFRQFGNLISASIPAAMSLAKRDGALHRGQKIVMCPATAGMAFGLIETEY